MPCTHLQARLTPSVPGVVWAGMPHEFKGENFRPSFSSLLNKQIALQAPLRRCHSQPQTSFRKESTIPAYVGHPSLMLSLCSSARNTIGAVNWHHMQTIQFHPCVILATNSTYEPSLITNCSELKLWLISLAAASELLLTTPHCYPDQQERRKCRIYASKTACWVISGAYLVCLSASDSRLH